MTSIQSNTECDRNTTNQSVSQEFTLLTCVLSYHYSHLLPVRYQTIFEIHLLIVLPPMLFIDKDYQLRDDV